MTDLAARSGRDRGGRRADGQGQWTVATWAISDLHLSLARPDPREAHGARWAGHVGRLEQQWQAVVRADDLVLIPGDLSMARSHRDLQPDLAWLARLPGRKVLSPGNHDRWWNDLEAVRRMLRPSQLAVDGDALEVGPAIVCGARGMAVPTGAEADSPAVRASVESTLDQVDRALTIAAGLRRGDQPLYMLWHFPPFDSAGRPGPWVDRFEAYGVTDCLYGHMHRSSQWGGAAQGRVGTIRYHFVAADAVGFRPLRIDRNGGSTAE